MKLTKQKLSIALLFLTIFCAKTRAQENYQIATWYNFKTAVVTYTFDDNTSNQLPKALPLFDKYGYKATFFVVIDWGPNWSGLQKASDNGHEVASHTVSHANLGQLLDRSLTTELEESQSTVRSKITGAECFTLAYPNCIKGKQSIMQEYYIGGRTCSGQIISSNPSNYFELSSVIVGSQGTLKNAELLNTQVSSTIDAKGWSVLLMHGVDDDGGYSPIASSELESHLAYINEHESEVWVATFANVIKYIKERKSATVTEDILTSDSIRVNISDDLNDTIYNAAITIRRVLPSSWNDGGVIINGKKGTSKTETIDGTKYITFSGVPDADVVYLLNADIISSVNEQLQDQFKIAPNPFNHEINIALDGEFSYKIFSIDGKLIENGTVLNSQIIGQKLEKGTYLLNINQDFNSFTKRIIKQ